MKRLAAALALFLPLTANADDFARTTAAEQLVDLMNQLVPFDATLQQSSLAIIAPLAANMPCPAKAVPDLQKTLTGIITYKELRPYIIKSYAQTFDFNELATIKAFYQSNAGHRLLQLTPQLEANLQQQTVKMIETKLPELKKVIDTHNKDKACPAPATTDETTEKKT